MNKKVSEEIFQEKYAVDDYFQKKLSNKGYRTVFRLHKGGDKDFLYIFRKLGLTRLILIGTWQFVADEWTAYFFDFWILETIPAYTIIFIRTIL